MKTIFQYLLLTAACAALGACQDFSDDTAFTPETPELSFEETSITAEKATKDYELSIKSNLPWRIECDKDWVSFDPSYGQGDATITVTVAANRTLDERTATISAYVIKGENVTLPVTQAAASASDLATHYYVKTDGSADKDGLTWETATTYDVGFDMDLFRNRLSIGFDWYRRYTTDMYTVGVSLPSVYGTDAPKGNNASLKTNGWELSVGWRDSFELGGKAFSYNVKAMVWDARTWVTEYINPTGALGDYYEGKELGEIWGYRVEGLFRDQEDIDSHAEQSFLQTLDKVTRPGQVKFADLNQDGKIDRGAYTTADPGDLTVIGNETPRYCYGINLGFNWNGIGISTKASAKRIGIRVTTRDSSGASTTVRSATCSNSTRATRSIAKSSTTGTRPIGPATRPTRPTSHRSTVR